MSAAESDFEIRQSSCIAGVTLLQTGDASEALRMLVPLVERFPSNPTHEDWRALWETANYYHYQGDPGFGLDLILRAFNNSKEINPRVRSLAEVLCVDSERWGDLQFLRQFESNATSTTELPWMWNEQQRVKLHESLARRELEDWMNDWIGRATKHTFNDISRSETAPPLQRDPAKRVYDCVGEFFRVCGPSIYDKRIEKALESFEPTSEQTILYDALIAAVNAAQSLNSGTVPSCLVVTEGEDKGGGSDWGRGLNNPDVIGTVAGLSQLPAWKLRPLLDIQDDVHSLLSPAGFCLLAETRLLLSVERGLQLMRLALDHDQEDVSIGMATVLFAMVSYGVYSEVIDEQQSQVEWLSATSSIALSAEDLNLLGSQFASDPYIIVAAFASSEVVH